MDVLIKDLLENEVEELQGEENLYISGGLYMLVTNKPPKQVRRDGNILVEKFTKVNGKYQLIN